MLLRGGPMAVFVGVVFGAGSASAITVVDATLKVRPTDSPQGTTSATLRAARNEFEPFQIVVAGGAGVERNRADHPDGAGFRDAGHQLDAHDVRDVLALRLRGPLRIVRRLWWG